LKGRDVERLQLGVDQGRVVEHQPDILVFDVNVSVPLQFIDGPDIVLIDKKMMSPVQSSMAFVKFREMPSRSSFRTATTLGIRLAPENSRTISNRPVRGLVRRNTTNSSGEKDWSPNDWSCSAGIAPHCRFAMAMDNFMALDSYISATVAY